MHLSWRPTDPEERARWDQAALRWRMLYGRWEDDLLFRIRESLGTIRADNIGMPDLSSNALRQYANQTSVLYDADPDLIQMHAPSRALLSALWRAGGVTSILARNQRDTIGIRENAVFLDADEDGTPRLHLIPPHRLIIKAQPSSPDVPARVEWFRCWELAGEHRWVRQIWDLTDPAQPIYTVRDEQNKEDLSAEINGESGWSGETYPWRYADGRPFIPVVLYHAAWTSQLWDTFEGRELVDGTLRAGVLWSYFSRALMTAAWAQRWAAGVELAADTDDKNGVGGMYVPMMPDSVLIFEPHSSGTTQPQVGQWDPSVQPEQMLAAVSGYEARQIANAGVAGTDFLRTSGDARSGYALALSNEAKREASRRLAPSFERADRELLAKMAALYRIRTQISLREDGWGIRYQTLPPSAEERQAIREQIEWDEKRGLVSTTEAYQRSHIGASVEEARAALVAIAVENATTKKMIQEALLEAKLVESTPEANVASGVVMQNTWAVVKDVFAAGPDLRESGLGMMTEMMGRSAESAARIMGKAGLVAPVAAPSPWIAGKAPAPQPPAPEPAP